MPGLSSSPPLNRILEQAGTTTPAEVTQEVCQAAALKEAGTATL